MVICYHQRNHSFHMVCNGIACHFLLAVCSPSVYGPAPFALAKPLRDSHNLHAKPDKRNCPDESRSIFTILGNSISLYFCRQFAGHHPWLSYSYQLSFHNGSAGDLCLLCRSYLRNRSVGLCRLSQALHRAHALDVSVPCYRRVFPHIGPGCKAIWEYDERDHVDRDSSHYCTSISACASGIARASYRSGAGIHLRGTGHSVHRLGELK